MSPKRSIEVLAAVVLAALPLTITFAQDAPPTPGVEKRILPQFEHSTFCPAGYATTYTIQCDPGSRAPIDQIWNPAGVGVEICRASQPVCTPIEGLNPNARPGFEVQDSTLGYSGSLVLVSFGLDRLLGEAP